MRVNFRGVQNAKNPILFIIQAFELMEWCT